jgi:hypothetical protein
MAVFRDTQRKRLKPELLQPAKNDRISALVTTVNAPPTNNRTSVSLPNTFQRSHEPCLVPRANRIGSPLESWRFCGTEGKQIEYKQSSTLPLSCEANTPADCWVVKRCISRRGVKHDERGSLQLWADLAGQDIAVFPAS